MTSASTAGPPPSRPLPNRGGGLADTPPSFNDGKPSTAKDSGRIFPHIDKLKASRPDVNPNSPLQTLVRKCAACSANADALYQFGRPDAALEEFIKASIIFLEILPAHRDFQSIKGDRGDLRREYTDVQRRLAPQFERFEQVKKIIKENNIQNGVTSDLQNGHANQSVDQDSSRVQPTFPVSNHQSKLSASTRSEVIDQRLLDAPAVPTTPLSNGYGLPVRQKPKVHPKPDTLHGNAIKPSERPGSSDRSESKDIAARFSRLRGESGPTVVQDPRIRTQPISVPTHLQKVAVATPQTSNPNSTPLDVPSGPRDMPLPLASSRSRPLIGMNIPPMPRAPDAIYSPARNFDPATGLDTSHSSGRGVYSSTSRPGSSAAVSVGVAGRVDPTSYSTGDGPSEYFPLVPSKSNDTKARQSSEKSPRFSNIITAEQLFDALKTRNILLVDIRPREEFDGGHIMAQNIVCIEPIILRNDVSAEDLSGSFVLSPEGEQRLFNERDSFDIVVYYDADSIDLRPKTSNYGHELALENFSKAVYDYGYEKKSKQRPILLVGGLDSWIELLGPGSLQASMAATGSARPVRKNYGHLTRRKMPPARRPTYVSRPLTKEDESKWAQLVQNETQRYSQIHASPTGVQDENADDNYFVRTTEDFMRRFPEAGAVPESMASPRIVDESVHVAATRRDELNSMMPKIPTRPAPALPRQSYSGVSNRDPSAVTLPYKQSPSSVTSGLPWEDYTISRPLKHQNHCGLQNLGNSCYANSVVQALSSSIPFTTWLLGYDFTNPLLQAPGKSDEYSNPHPQLMVRNLANLLRHLWSGRYSYVTPKTLKDYTWAIKKATCKTKQEQEEAIGGPRQQDASEYLTFLLDILTDETNLKRDQPFKQISKEQEKTRDIQFQRKTDLEAATISWSESLLNMRSPIMTQYFGTQHVDIRSCSKCGFLTRSIVNETSIMVHLPPDDRSTTLRDCLRERFKDEILDESKCENCGNAKNNRGRHIMTHAPEILVLQLNRTSYDSRTYEAKKNNNLVSFEPRLDMTPYFSSPYFVSGGSVGKPDSPVSTTGPLVYNIFAVIQHLGNTLKGGHYWTLAKDHMDENMWYEFNDSHVRPTTWRQTQRKDSFLLFFERQKLRGPPQGG